MNKSRSVMRREVEQRGEQMQQIDCINQQARDCKLTKRSQAERLAIADSLIASVWEEYLNGSIDRGTLQVAAYIQANTNRIVWKLNELNNPNTPNTSKALETLDCISRQAVVDLLDEYMGRLCIHIGTPNDTESYSYARGLLVGVINNIKHLLPVQPEQQWIPCSERLPEDYVDALVWFEYFRYGNYNRLYQTHGIGDYSSKYDSWMINHESGWRKLRVYAWMPLPEPYKPPTRSQYRRMKEQRGEKE